MEPGTQQSLIQILALFGGKWWAGELEKTLDDPPDERPGAGWPIGPKMPRFEYPPVPDAIDAGSTPVLSVMMPVFEVKREDWLHACLRSALDQLADAARFEFVVVDDASTNDVAQRIAASYHPRVRYLRNATNLGLVGNHNYCISQARGTYIQFLHQDDLVDPGFYDALLPRLQNRPELMAGFTRFRYVNVDGDDIATPKPERQVAGVLANWLPHLATGQRIQFPALIVRRAAFTSLGGFSPSLSFAFDWEMWGRLAHAGAIWYEPQTLARYRIHSQSATEDLDLLKRLSEEMQVAAVLLSKLSEQERLQHAPAAFKALLLHTWQKLIKASVTSSHDNHAELLALLLDSWATPEQAREILEGLALNMTPPGRLPNWMADLGSRLRTAIRRNP